jgi:nucleoside-diphosphate-sugar epimerase
MDKASRILITGGSGFVGLNLAARLLELGFQMVSTVGKRSGYDLTNDDDVKRLFDCYPPDYVFHLAAAVGGIGANRKHPGRFWYQNSLLGLNVLEAARRYNVKRTVIVGTTCSYPKYCQVPFKEADIWNGYPEETNAPYGVAKKSIMIGAKAYSEEYGLDIVCPVLTNLYGPGDHYTAESSHVIPDMIRKFSDAKKAGSSVTLWGDGSPTRDFLYVTDAVDGLIKIASAPDVGPDPVNFGSGEEISMLTLTRLVSETVGYESGISWDTSKPNGQPRRCLDISRARALGWAPATTLQHGLMVTYEDYLGRTASDNV